MVGHSPVFQILLQVVVRMSIMATPPAWTNSAGMLSTWLTFPVGSQVLLCPPQSHSCKDHSCKGLTH